jgi:hypothetical protein
LHVALAGSFLTAEVLKHWLTRLLLPLPLPLLLLLLQEGGEQLVWCETCGNNIHKGCWAKWADTKRRNHEGVSCVLCRAPWHDSAAGAAAGQRHFVACRAPSGCGYALRM